MEKLEAKLSKNVTKSDLKLSYYAKYLDVNNNDCNIKYKLNPNKIARDRLTFCVNDFY